MKISSVIFLLFFQFAVAQNEKFIFPKIETHLSIPVSISVPEIESLINKSIIGVIYEDNSFTDNDNDQFKTKVSKNGNINLTVLKGNRMLIEIPLKIWAQKGYGALGYYTYQETDFRIKMKFVTSIEFNSNWNLSTHTVANGFEWTEKPVLIFAKVSLPISPLVESPLKEQQSKFCSVIDAQIAEKFDLKPYLLNIWNQFATPIQISEEYDTWLKLTPKAIKMTPVVAYSDLIKTTVGLDLYSETYVGQIPLADPLTMKLPNFQSSESLSPNFNLKTTANISYDNATQLAKKQFLGQEYDKVKIEDISVYQEKQAVAVEIRTSGKLEGNVVVSGFPYYDENQHKIRIRDTELHVKTKNLLQKAALLIFKGKIKRAIEEDYGIPLTDIENNSKKSLLESFNKEYYPGIFLKGKLIELKPVQILLFDRFISIVIDTKANLQLDVKELNF